MSSESLLQLLHITSSGVFLYDLKQASSRLTLPAYAEARSLFPNMRGYSGLLAILGKASISQAVCIK